MAKSVSFEDSLVSNDSCLSTGINSMHYFGYLVRGC